VLNKKVRNKKLSGKIIQSVRKQIFNNTILPYARQYSPPTYRENSLSGAFKGFILIITFRVCIQLHPFLPPLLTKVFLGHIIIIKILITLDAAHLISPR
jgi:hypothetical protein